VSSTWASGLYIAVFTTTSGYRSLTPFVVTEPDSAAPIGVVLPFLSYQGANRWPLDTVHGSSLGFGYDPETGQAMFAHRALEVSLDRPYTGSGLPEAAQLDIEVITWLETQGYKITYLADADLHSGLIDPSRFAGLFFVGRHAYWTMRMRDNVSAAAQAGTSLAFLSAGTCEWHARLAETDDGSPDRILACYKSDPDLAATDGPATTRWRWSRPGPDRPEQEFCGTLLNGKATPPTELVVANAEHWVWAGAEVVDGSPIPDIVAGFVDEVDPVLRMPANGRSTILAASPYLPSGRTANEIQNSNICELTSGAFIFASGTDGWAQALGQESSRDRRIETATRNVLDRLAAGPVSTAGSTTTAWPDARAVRALAASPVAAENGLAGSRAWRIGADATKEPDDIERQIAGYASATSVVAGETIDFAVTVNPAGPFTISIYRVGHYNGDGGRLMQTTPALNGVTQSNPQTYPVTRTVSCDWPTAWTLTVPPQWASGLYLAVFTSRHGYRSYAPFVVRDPARRDNLCVVLGFSTYQAYNQWPLDGVTGRNLYNGYSKNSPALDPEERSFTVSFDRPYSRSGQPSRFEYDLAFVRWAEASKFDLTYATSLDLHAGRLEPGRYAGLVFPSHDEYWSVQMRDNATSALDRGTSLAFLQANNIYWHVRIGDSADGRPERTVTCYKSEDDPEPGPAGMTIHWRNRKPGPRLPEQRLLGIQYNGIVARPAPLIVAQAGHWFWSRTGVRNGNAIANVVAGEADGHDPRVASPAGTLMLARSPYELSSGGREIQNTSVYETENGAVVFASGTNDWPGALGLKGHVDRRIQRATANLLDRMQAPRLPAVEPTVDAAADRTTWVDRAGAMGSVVRKAGRRVKRRLKRSGS
jgi:hypothetical protein